jgi:2-polyprenyl-3-methyl-5-hydroxy-6-metoxy-1,4-benzoquinol methylase
VIGTINTYHKGIIELDGIESILRHIGGGLVLDIATHEGHFVKMLAEQLSSYQQIVGIDIDEKSIRAATTDLTNENIRFMVMDADQLAFTDSSFDSVTISASLHHLANVQHVLSEMVSMLKPGGHFILLEMHGDTQTGVAQTSISLHQWVAEVDSELGLLHRKTFSRQEFVDCTTQLDLSKVEYTDIIDIASDPKELVRTAQLEKLIMSTMQRAGGTPQPAKLNARGNQLLHRLYKIGAQREPSIAVVGIE